MPQRSRESGYAMAALLVAISIMGVMLGVALPTWSTLIRREKEEEFVFRANQYARAIQLYQPPVCRRVSAEPRCLDKGAIPSQE